MLSRAWSVLRWLVGTLLSTALQSWLNWILSFAPAAGVVLIAFLRGLPWYGTVLLALATIALSLVIVNQVSVRLDQRRDPGSLRFELHGHFGTISQLPPSQIVAEIPVIFENTGDLATVVKQPYYSIWRRRRLLPPALVDTRFTLEPEYLDLDRHGRVVATGFVAPKIGIEGLTIPRRTRKGYELRLYRGLPLEGLGGPHPGHFIEVCIPAIGQPDWRRKIRIDEWPRAVGFPGRLRF
ncbi:MAG TPA: hypothetical protein VFC51_12220 [Chloroflexota bacterium]|nr:hypothetical protein [Chloroflexota bacterium]